MATTLVDAMKMNTHRSSNCAAMNPPTRGPASIPSRIAVSRKATVRPRFAIFVRSAIRTLELIVQMAMVMPASASSRA